MEKYVVCTEILHRSAGKSCCSFCGPSPAYSHIWASKAYAVYSGANFLQKVIYLGTKRLILFVPCWQGLSCFKMNYSTNLVNKSVHTSFCYHYAVYSAFTSGIFKRAPSSSKLILLYNLLADNKLCSLTALSKMLESSAVVPSILVRHEHGSKFLKFISSDDSVQVHFL